jgi:2-polyprenyl-3-methyl-5-hydroxy-6-metoxy-1,4-benzoquinol methylase
MHVYSDSGNQFVARLVPSNAKHILDVGCGCGDTAALVKGLNPGAWIEGITFNSAEALAAGTILDRVHIFDIEQVIPVDIKNNFDCLLFSHILEHLRDPSGIVLRFLSYLDPGGTVVIAVPNILEWRTRFKLLCGDFAYADAGVLDRTHLKFFTFESVDGELLRSELQARVTLLKKFGDGAVPLGPLRRVGFMHGVARAIDRLGVRICPNLFAQQVVIVARKNAASG